MRIPASLAAAVLAVTTLAACGVGGGRSTAAPQEKVDANAQLKGAITFQTWALKNDKFTPYFTKLVADFQARHPGTTVNWIDQPGEGYDTKLNAQVAGDSLPDVVNLPVDLAYPLAKTGNLLDLTANVPTLESEWLPSIVDAYKYPDVNGGASSFAFPWYTGTDVLYWNKDMLARDGLDPNNLPKSREELFAAAKTMHDKSGGKDFLLSTFPGASDITSTGTPWMTPDGKKFAFNTPEAAALLDKYRQAYKDGLFPPGILTSDYQGNAELFKKRVVAMTTAGGDAITNFNKDVPSLKDKVIPSENFFTPPLYTQGLSVSAKSKNLPLALAFAKFATGNDNQIAFIKLAPGFLPGTAAAAKDPSYSKSDGTPQGDASVYAFRALQKAKLATPPQWSPEMNDYLKQQITLAMTGKQTSRQALDKGVEKANSMLEQ
ncbi:ABC transporter substrate-binding protein [Sphaerisporangium fuscum]|uniref:ABC transporter substrate-binding protein n=1 Tax=Sphaerisporangium fuscum TaxID=2835868 RepID=UPI001BDC01BF|nr:sugar ABC transporter substrate-binding protein [Sphaerisporangium fuscum]